MLASDKSKALAEGFKEEKYLERGLAPRDLEKESKEKDHGRGEAFKDHFERLAIMTMYSFFATLFIMGVIWLFHMLAPEDCKTNVVFGVHICRWLKPDSVIVIQDVLTGSIIAGLVADHFKKRMGMR